MRGDGRARGAALRTLRTIADFRVAVAVLFALGLATPRAPLVFHTHAGGEHAHVHADGVLAAILGGSAHRPHQAQAKDRGPAYAADRGDAGGHVHHQSQYHAAVAAVAPFVAVTAPLAALSFVTVGSAPTRVATAASARGPPLSLLA